MTMRQNIKQNFIAYALLIGLFVCGFVFIVTPVMAQDITNAELKTSIENLNKNTGNDTANWIVAIITILSTLAVAAIGWLVTFIIRRQDKKDDISHKIGALETHTGYFKESIARVESTFDNSIEKVENSVKEGIENNNKIFTERFEMFQNESTTQRKEQFNDFKKDIETGFEKIQGNIKDVESRITKIETWKTREIIATLNQDIMGNNSPLVLRETGKKYLQESGGEEYLKKTF